MSFVVIFLVILSGLQVVLSLRPNKWWGIALPLAGVVGMAINMIVVTVNYQGLETSIPRSNALLALLLFYGIPILGSLLLYILGRLILRKQAGRKRSPLARDK